MALLSGCSDNSNGKNSSSSKVEDPKLAIRATLEGDTIQPTVFQSVNILGQTWMKSNLDVVMFRNGDYIQQAKTDEAWKGAAKRKEPAWCYYNNDKTNGSKHGKLYNWYAVNDPRGLAPAGWHIPAKSEFEKLDANWVIVFRAKF
jgi:uncharacterized protein (TIGR02145 family)